MSILKEVKRISIAGYLASLGIHPAKRTSGGFMCLSPLRHETNPSFKIDENKNLWFDHGLGIGGSIIDLVMKVEHCDLKEAVDKLRSGDTPIWAPPPPSDSPKCSAQEIIAIKPLQHLALIRYLESREISLELATRYCSEVHYHNVAGRFFSIGFKNDCGGFELRNKMYKGCVFPKTITTIPMPAGSDTVRVFEGFIDFLSCLAGEQVLIPATDVVVLNSVINLGKALPFLRAHKRIETFLDNDDAGRRAQADLERLIPEAAIRDCSATFAPLKDVNDYLISVRP